MSATSRILDRLEGVRQCGPDNWRARCPAHEGKSLTLSIRQHGNGAGLRCFAECSTGEILDAIGLSAAELFDDNEHRYYQPGDRNPRWNISPRELLNLIEIESIVIMLAAAGIAAGCECLNEVERARVGLAESRLRKVLEVLHG